MTDSIDLDWYLFALRLLFAGLLYLFLIQVLRVTSRELTALARRDELRPARLGRTAGRLVVLDPAESELEAGTSFDLPSTALIGRHPDCSIVIDEPFVSAEHATLERRGDDWLLRDLGSTNGTFLNGAEVRSPTPARDQDIVQFGRVRCRLLDEPRPR